MKKNLSNSVKRLICLCCIISMLFPFIVRAQEIPKQYREDWSVSWPNRKAQHLEIKAYIDKLLDEELFTFVLNPEVDPTNNLPERLQRAPAQDRDAGRTSKTAAGAHRRSVIVSVLESLRTNLAAFNLESVLEEVSRWMTEGLSLFARQWHEVMGASARTALDTG